MAQVFEHPVESAVLVLLSNRGYCDVNKKPAIVRSPTFCQRVQLRETNGQESTLDDDD